MAASAHGENGQHVNGEESLHASVSDDLRWGRDPYDYRHMYEGMLREGTARCDEALRVSSSAERESSRPASESTRRVASRSTTQVKSDGGGRSVTPTRRSCDEMESGSSVTGSPSRVGLDVEDGDKRRRVSGKQRREALYGRPCVSRVSEDSDASKDHGIAGDGLPPFRRDASEARLLGTASPRAESGARDPEIMRGSPEESSGLSLGRALPGGDSCPGAGPSEGLAEPLLDDAAAVGTLPQRVEQVSLSGAPFATDVVSIDDEDNELDRRRSAARAALGAIGPGERLAARPGEEAEERPGVSSVGAWVSGGPPGLLKLGDLVREAGIDRQVFDLCSDEGDGRESAGDGEEEEEGAEAHEPR